MESLNTRFEKEVFQPYLDLLKAEYRFHARFSHAKRVWEEKLNSDELVNGPYLERAKTFKAGVPIDQLSLDERTKATIRSRLNSRSLWKHQTDAISLVLDGKNVVVATGTSSGKTLCYQIPILDDLVREPSPGLRAVIIYPLNALVNDQLSEWEQMLAGFPQVRFARFTGQTPSNFNDYEARIREACRAELSEGQLPQQELQKAVDHRVAEQLRNDPPNRINHREGIRENPPNVLITNFSMLEYLLERPVDAPIFEKARLKFLVLDEAHAYRGVQATEIAFLIRRLKDRLGAEHLRCIATSATLGTKGDEVSASRIQKFATELFGEEFGPANPIYGSSDEPTIKEPIFSPSPEQYISAVDHLRAGREAEVSRELGISSGGATLAEQIVHDANFHKLRSVVLQTPIVLKAAARLLWPNSARAEDALQALMEIVASAKKDDSHEELLPTRLHYFIRAQDGLHVCLHKKCPGRLNETSPAVFVSRKSSGEAPHGDCPDCWSVGQRSNLVEVVACRKCGYLFGALQDLGPRRAQMPRGDPKDEEPHFDSFSTELGWAGDSFWSYFSVDLDLPYPKQSEKTSEDADDDDLFGKPAEIIWCVVCAKKRDGGRGDTCSCESPHTRLIQIFHRQCKTTGKAKDRDNLFNHEKALLSSCPNCHARNASGIEPLQRFQESDDEMGLAMAVPLAHFQVRATSRVDRKPRKLLCFTDHRQRAAAFPSLLEEETFARDMGRKIVKLINEEPTAIDIVSLGERLADAADSSVPGFDPEFFLPISRYPDEELDAREKRNLWLAETFAYFGIPDSARESAEDLGLVSVRYNLGEAERTRFQLVLSYLAAGGEELNELLQVLLGYMRQRKAFTLPKGRVQPTAPAFGRVTADISFVERREGVRNTNGWLPSGERDNVISDYLARALKCSRVDAIQTAKAIWDVLTSSALLIREKDGWKLGHEKIVVTRASSRYLCSRCGAVTTLNFRGCCSRRECDGVLQAFPFDGEKEGIVARWVAGTGLPHFTTLKSEEHTAQINKDLAKRIEDRFRAGVELEAQVQGVNLLSSTTTFEMGINIGDLQKVLLRNAPPSSASYVQRVGRAGRGREKNAVAVTLCRRTKYDADAWNDPARLMAGTVRSPVVYLRNQVIAQRHFNALVFAQFLRVKLRDEQALGPVSQKVRLESFLPPSSRANIPEAWFKIKPSGTFLDFALWLKERSETDTTCTEAGRSLLNAVRGVDAGKESACQTYEEIFRKIGAELMALVAEREKLHEVGGHVADVEVSIKNLLGSDVISVLAKRGFLPRYAFPLDVVALETGRTRWSRDSDVDLSRDRGMAIAEFAPGAQVIAHKKVFTSAGLYVVGEKDRPERSWYSKCLGCEQIRVGKSREELAGSCSVCAKVIGTNQVHHFVQPEAFSVRLDDQSGAARFRRSTLIRQRQSVTHFIDHVDDGSFRDKGHFDVALSETGWLFRYNLGPASEGFMLCHVCGASEPMRGYKAARRHKRLRSFAGSMECANSDTWKALAFGHSFQSFCLIARPKRGLTSIESLAFGLQRGICATLDLDASDIGVSWRWIANKQERTGSEIVLYDQAPGGAGFVKEAVDSWSEVIAAAMAICETCTCETACYDCLKTYSNQTHHDRLNRHSVVEALKTP